MTVGDLKKRLACIKNDDLELMSPDGGSFYPTQSAEVSVLMKPEDGSPYTWGDVEKWGSAIESGNFKMQMGTFFVID